MGEHFDSLGSRKLPEITLPGSHNSGNYEGGLSAEPLCRSDYRYGEYLADASTAAAQAAGKPPLSQPEFDKHMIPWNINHFGPMAEQLARDGTRFFHLKICNFGEPGDVTMDLSNVRFQHRGYTTRETVASTIDDLKAFLAAHPKEVVVLGFNNLHNSVPGGFHDTDVLALSDALVDKAGSSLLVTAEDLWSKTLGELVAAGRRLAIFMGAGYEASKRLPEGIIPSFQFLAEDWDDVMASGDLKGSDTWLVRDLREKATQRDRYYVMQANPNNKESLMFRAMNTGEGPQSNRAFLDPFLANLGTLVADAVAETPRIRINVVDSDFLNISKTFEIAMRLNGLETLA